MKRTCICVLLTGLMIGVAGCQTSTSSGSGGDEWGRGPDNEGDADFRGTWAVTGSDVSTCEDSGRTWENVTQIIQNGNAVTIANAVAGSTLTGTISEGRLSLTGSQPMQGGTTHTQGADITLAEGGDSFSGTMTWTWTQGAYECSGYSPVTGTRLGGGEEGGGGGGGGEG